MSQIHPQMKMPWGHLDLIVLFMFHQINDSIMISYSTILAYYKYIIGLLNIRTWSLSCVLLVFF
jgi:hypothetical protein